MDENYKDAINEMDKYIYNLKELSRTNPELAKKIAKEGLQKSGILGEDGKLASPYNGQKVNDNDFTKGPEKIYYGEDER